VETFDPEKGQIHKVERGDLKIEIAIDCLVSASFLVNKQYKYFCNWGKHLNIDNT